MKWFTIHEKSLARRIRLDLVAEYQIEGDSISVRLIGESGLQKLPKESRDDFLKAMVEMDAGCELFSKYAGLNS